MAFDRSPLVENDYSQLSEKYERILRERKDLEGKKQEVHELGQNFKDKKQEWQALGEQLFRLANQNNSFSVKSEGGLRDVCGEVRSTDTNMSWDFEGLNVSGTGPRASGGDELLEKIDAQLQAEINAKDRDLHLLQEQMRGKTQVEKHSDAIARGYSSDRLQNSNTEQLNVSSGGDDIFASPSTKVRELQTINEQMAKQVEKLLENSQELNNRIGVLTKQKEELLQVNHQWDDQYRQLKADKERLNSELRKRSGARDSAEVQRQGQNTDEEMTSLVQELTQKNDELSQQVASLIEKRQQSDRVWVAAKKAIEEEREGRAAAVQAAQAAAEQCKQLEQQLEIEKQTQAFLKQEVERLASVNSNTENSAGGAQMVSQNVAEQIEMLKQQISVYADDFANERSDRERIQADREAQKEKLTKFEREIALLKEQIRVYRDDFDKERRDKERVQRVLRERGAVQIPDEPWYMVPPTDYVTMRPVQRRQTVNQDRQYRYNPREIQEIAFQQQQPLHPRGGQAGGHPGGVCHGCEADCDVIDGNAILQCPRCERVFASNERRPFEEHIDKCTT